MQNQSAWKKTTNILCINKELAVNCVMLVDEEKMKVFLKVNKKSLQKLNKLFFYAIPL